MDPGSDSDGEGNSAAGPFMVQGGVGLKPQMDSIFAEIEKSLPTIDFDLSDVSSDTDEPMIFHRHLKTTEVEYEDEKDLDTSLSGESAVDLFRGPPIPSLDKNSTSLSGSPPSGFEFDNDLAALLAATEGTRADDDDDDEEKVGSWRDLERLVQRQKAKLPKPTTSVNTTTTTTATFNTDTSETPGTSYDIDQEDTTASTSTTNTNTATVVSTNNNTSTGSFEGVGSTSNNKNSTTTTTTTTTSRGTSHVENTNTRDPSEEPSGLLEVGNLIMAQLVENARFGERAVFGGRTPDPLNFRSHDAGTSTMEDSSISSVQSSRQNNSVAGNRERRAMVDSGVGSGDGNDPDDDDDGAVGDDDDEAEMDSNREVEMIISSANRKREEQRRKDKDVALTFMSSKAPQLSTQILDSIDWDSPTLDVETTPWNPPAEVRDSLPYLAARARLLSHPPDSWHGQGDGAATQDTENLTLIQRLARYSLRHDNTDANRIDPQTGAFLDIIEPPSSSSSSSSATREQASAASPVERSGSRKPAHGLPHASTRAVDGAKGGATVTHTSSTSTTTSTSQPPPASAAMKAMMESLNKLKPEPETVFLDLRGFSKHKEEEKQRMATVSRVLGLGEQQSSDDSSDSEDDTAKWLEQRQRLKQTLVSRGTSTAPTQPPLAHTHRTQAPRVIQMQNRTQTPPSRTTSSSGTSTSSASQNTSVAMHDGNRASMEDSNRQREAERLKEQQKEAARLVREEQDRVRAARLRMLSHLQSMASTAAVSENKPCAENTPVIFDMEASYESRLPILPSVLDREELLLLTVQLSSSGEITLHNAPRSSKTSAENVINALPKSYLYLLSWLISLIPPDAAQLEQWLRRPVEGATHYPQGFPPFHVVGLQQLLVDEGLTLFIAVCPSPLYMLHKDDRNDRLKKGKKGEDSSRFFRFMDTFISRSCLSSVECWPRYLGDDLTKENNPSEFNACLTFANPHLPFLGKPLSAYMQLHKDGRRAVDEIFNRDVGFFWQTLDPGETTYQHNWTSAGDENVPQNSLFLLSQQALFRPQVVYDTLMRTVSQSLDISGLRLLYPSPTHTSPATPPTDPSPTEGATPVLAVAVRGPHARIRLISMVGPTDFSLAKRTDPLSLTAQYGNAQSGLQIYCPRNAERAKCELARWFGARVPGGDGGGGSMEVGLPYRLREEHEGTGGGGGGTKGKKGKRPGSSGAAGALDLQTRPCRPPAALTATTLSHVVLVISPLVPHWMLGFLVSLMQQKAAFQPRGVRRLCLSVKKAVSLGIPSKVHAMFCPGVNLEVAAVDSGEQQMESGSPCTVLILERENASHHAASLTHILATELKNQDVTKWMDDRTEMQFELLHLFHVADFSDTLLTSLGGHFDKCPSVDPLSASWDGGVSPALNSPKDVEQVAVLILLGRDLVRDWGSFLQNLQEFSTTGSQLSDFELLGIKWLSRMNSFQTREVTPYEIGDSRWRDSIKFLASEPAVVMALRSVNVYKKLEPFVTLPVSTSTITSSTSTSTHNPLHPRRLMSRSPREAYNLLKLFFWHHDLFPDPDCRSLLPFLPESRLYFFTVPCTSGEEDSKPRIALKSLESQDLTREGNLSSSLVVPPCPLPTMMLIKPRAVQRHLAKILRRSLHEGFRVQGLRLEVMDKETARRFLALDFEPGTKMHDLHLEYLTSEPSLFLALSRENGVKKLRDLLGPDEPQQARRQSQFYWRGIYGLDPVHNALYASRTYIESMWDLHTFFPDGLCSEPSYLLDMEQILCPALDSVIDLDFAKNRHTQRRESSPQSDPPSAISDAEQRVHSLLMQTTCLVLPPRLVESNDGGGGEGRQGGHTDAPFVHILNVLIARGFALVGARMVWMTQEQAQTFLHLMHDVTQEAVGLMSSSPILVLALERDNAVLAFDSTLGTGVEAQSVLSNYGKDIYRPSDIKQANQLLSFFFDHLMPGSHVDVCPLAPSSPSPP